MTHITLYGSAVYSITLSVFRLPDPTVLNRYCGEVERHLLQHDMLQFVMIMTRASLAP